MIEIEQLVPELTKEQKVQNLKEKLGAVIIGYKTRQIYNNNR